MARDGHCSLLMAGTICWMIDLRSSCHHEAAIGAEGSLMIAHLAETLPSLSFGQAAIVLMSVAVLALNGWDSGA